MPLEPFGDFLAAVAHLAERDAGADGRAAREYLDAFSKRREIVAQSSGKYELLGSLAPAIRDAHGALVFTETVRAANHAINRLDPLVSIDLITGSTARAATPGDPRRSAGPATRRGRRTPRARRGHRRARREPRDRHEREPHPAPDDPADGPHPAPQAARGRGPLRDHVRQGHAGGPHATASSATASSTRSSASPRPPGCSTARTSRRSTRSSPRPAPRSCPSPSTSIDSERARWSDGDRSATRSTSRSPTRCSSFAHRDRADPRREPALARLDARLPAPSADAPYLEVELAELPEIAKPRVKPKRLVDRAGAARDRPHRIGVADQLHRLRRSVTARPVPVAGARPDRALPLRLTVSR